MLLNCFRKLRRNFVLLMTADSKQIPEFVPQNKQFKQCSLLVAFGAIMYLPVMIFLLLSITEITGVLMHLNIEILVGGCNCLRKQHIHTSSKLDSEEHLGFMSYTEGKSFALVLKGVPSSLFILFTRETLLRGSDLLLRIVV